MLNTLIQFFYEMNGLNKGIEIFTMEERIMLRRFLITMTTFLVVISGALCSGKSVSAGEQREQGDIRTIYVTTDGTTITKDKKVPAQITVVDKKDGDLHEDNVIYDTIESDGTIKVRGNSTAVADKKPFNISFSKAKDVFGMGKAKKWSLLANAFDKSLIRNRLAMEFATSLGLKYTSKSTYVDLYINDVYYGNYLLIESVEVGENRVDINSEGSNDVLLEKEYDRTEEGQTYLRTIRYGIRFNVGEPEGLAENTEQYKQTLTVLNRFETALENGDFEEVSKFVDLKSFANFYIVNELFKNVDFNYSSTRFYIKDGVLYAGPLWDLDLSGGNANPVNYPTYFENGDSSKGLWCQQFTWFKKLMEMPEFYNTVSERYSQISGLISNMIYGNTGNSINCITSTYKNSFARNYLPKKNGGAGWSVTNKDSADGISYAGTAKWKDYSSAIEYLRQWLIDRDKYLKTQFAGGRAVTPKKTITVTYNESADDIVLDGNPKGNQAMIGSYLWTDKDYQWLGFVNFKGLADSSYKYLVIRYTGDISTFRLEFRGKSGSDEIKSKPYWFKNVYYDNNFVSADEKVLSLYDTDKLLIIDLEKSGLDLGKYNLGFHMHMATSECRNGELTISDARLVKSVDIKVTGGEETTKEPPTTKPVSKPTTTSGTSTKVTRPKTTSIKSIKKAKKSLKISWKKIKGVKGYQIQYSTSKKFKKAKTVLIKNYKTTSKTIKKLKTKKKYYVRIRTYYCVKGKRVYSYWCKVKTGKTRK